jgi:hypothetical protein
MKQKMKLSSYSYIGYGLLVATVYGMDKYGIADYRVLGLFLMTFCFLLSDVINFYRKK